MKEKLKPHVVVTFTRAMLEEQHPCNDGFADAAPFLPAKLSTDPEQNIDLACAIAASELSGTSWLVFKLTGEVNTICCSSCTPDYGGREPDDPMVIAQYLAWIADYIATKAGR